jgi:hypothetical protein
MKRIWFLLRGAAAALPLAAQSFPEGDVIAYIDEVDAVNLPVNCKARMAVTDTYASGSDRASEGFFVRKDNKVVGSPRRLRPRRTSPCCAMRTLSTSALRPRTRS